MLYEDEETLVIDKPAGLVVHPRDGVMGVTLVNVVRARYPEVRQIGDGNRPGVVHRLDRDTSGVMAYAKSLAAQEALKEQWKARETLKLYVAVVEGVVDPPAGIIDAPVGPDPADPSPPGRRRAGILRHLRVPRPRALRARGLPALGSHTNRPDAPDSGASLRRGPPRGSGTSSTAPRHP